MNEKLVSVVVPIYNVEKYLDVCVESIVNQTYKNLEIILVDDGSPDACPKICDAWAKRDNRIRVVHKENQGLGMARNTGIDHATGEYICFFDSDDYVDLRTIDKAYEKAEKHAADIVIYGICDTDEEGNLLHTGVPESPKTHFSGAEVCEEFLPDVIDGSQTGVKIKEVPFSSCSCLFSMKLIRKAEWRFTSEREIISEDSYSLLRLFIHVESACVLREALYYYRKNTNSLSRSFRKDRFVRTKDFAMRALELAREMNYSTAVEERLCGLFFNFTIDAMKHIVFSNETFRDKYKAIRSIISDRFLRKCLRKCRYDKSRIAKYIFRYAVLLRLPLITYQLVYLRNSKH